MQAWIITPDAAGPANDLVREGAALQEAGNLPEAQLKYESALAADPRNAPALNNLAAALFASGFTDEALFTVERASIADGSDATVRMNLALMNLHTERMGEAVEQAEVLAEMIPAGPTGNVVRHTLASIYYRAGLPDKALPWYWTILETEPDFPAASENACFVQSLTDCSPEELLAERKRWHRTFGWKQPRWAHLNDRDPERPLKVGYVSGDWRQHSASFIWGDVVTKHSEGFIPYFYSNLPHDKEDGKTEQFKETVQARWRNVFDVGDDAVDDLIRRDGIDVLVDLSAHSAGNRLALFTRKPAPVQVSAWGFIMGTGCPEMDWFFADPVAVSVSERKWFAEKVYDLPCMVTMAMPDVVLPESSPPPCERNGYFTFGCFNRVEKLSDACLKSFGEILRRTPGSKIKFKDRAFHVPWVQRETLRRMGQGIDPSRVLFRTVTGYGDHLLELQTVDLILDPFPHGGGLAAMEALWMGVPLITLRGRNTAGRLASCVLMAMDRGEWITRDVEEYVWAANVTAKDSTSSVSIRKTLREEFLNSPAMNGYQQAVEKAYRTIWKEWCKS